MEPDPLDEDDLELESCDEDVFESESCDEFVLEPDPFEEDDLELESCDEDVFESESCDEFVLEPDQFEEDDLELELCDELVFESESCDEFVLEPDPFDEDDFELESCDEDVFESESCDEFVLEPDPPDRLLDPSDNPAARNLDWTRDWIREAIDPDPDPDPDPDDDRDDESCEEELLCDDVDSRDLVASPALAEFWEERGFDSSFADEPTSAFHTEAARVAFRASLEELAPAPPEPGDELDPSLDSALVLWSWSVSESLAALLDAIDRDGAICATKPLTAAPTLFAELEPIPRCCAAAVTASPAWLLAARTAPGPAVWRGDEARSPELCVTRPSSASPRSDEPEDGEELCTRSAACSARPELAC